MRRFVVGMDNDTVGIAASVFEDGRFLRELYIERSKAGHVLTDYAPRLERFFAWAGENRAAVFIEDVFLAKDDKRNVSVLVELANVQGEVRYVARRYGVLPELVTANEWRREVLGVTGPRDHCKKLAAQKALDLAGEWDRNVHVNEAICIGLYGWRVCEREAR
jgi:hypothetical protein